MKHRKAFVALLVVFFRLLFVRGDHRKQTRNADLVGPLDRKWVIVLQEGQTDPTGSFPCQEVAMWSAFPVCLCEYGIYVT